MITLINTWQQGDVSLIRHGGDLEKCLSEITAKGLIMPSKTDLYFPVSVSFVRMSVQRGLAVHLLIVVFGLKIA